MKKSIRDELYDYDLYVNQVSDLLLWHFDSPKEAADFFGVTPQTIARWKKSKKWPLAVIRLLLIMHRGYLPISKEWRDFKIRGDKLYTPAGRELSAYDLMELDIKMCWKTSSNIIQFKRKKKKRRRIKSKQGYKKPC